MNTKDYKGILFFDYDGTLVDGTIGIHEMSETTVQALKKAQERGYLTVLSSGRNVPMVRHVAELFDGVISTNGGYANIKGTEYCSIKLPKEYSKGIISFIEERTDRMFCTIETQEVTRGLQMGTMMSERHINHFGLDRDIFTPWEGQMEEEYYKITSMYDDKADYEELNRLFGDKVQIINHPTENYCEMMAKGCTKGVAVSEIIKKCDIPKEHMYAFGDSDNDYTMLEAVGHAIVMGKHSPSLEQIAEFITKPVEEEGIAFAMKHYGIIE